MTTTRPPTPRCPSCRTPLIRLQRSAPAGPARSGPVAAYPCGCWLTDTTAQALAAQYRAGAAAHTGGGP